MRINKYLAQIGVASRRSIDDIIEERRVTVNGKIATLGQSIDETKDQIKVDGQEVVNREVNNVYIILNKPTGYTSTAAKIKGEKNVLELVKTKTRLYPVGRLDRDSTGLILLTNDGELTQKLTHPKFHIPKTYEVKALGNIDDRKIEILQKGVVLEDGKTKPADVKIISKSLPRHCILQITLYEGKKRQIRRMAAALHIHIIDLKRIAIGPIKLGNIPTGKYRNLTHQEVKELKSLKS